MKPTEELKYGLQALGIYLGATVIDALTSLGQSSTMEEGNAFARHVDGTFWPAHYCVANAIGSVEMFLASLMLYWMFKPLGQKIAQVSISVPWLYFAWFHLDAATNNVLLRWPGLYVAKSSTLFQQLLGQ